MTNRNALVLCGLFTALSLQAGQQPSQSSQPASSQNTPTQESASFWSKQKWPILGTTLSAGAFGGALAYPNWGNYFINKGSNALLSTVYALGSAGRSAGGYASRAWDWSKRVPYAGVVPRGLGQLGSMGYNYLPSSEALKAAPGTIAGYATNPYIAQGIAQRLPSASFVKDYPGTTNVAAALAAAGAGYGLYKTSQYAKDLYYGPLEGRLENKIRALIAQENTKDISAEALANIHNQLDPLLAQKAEQLLASAPDTDVYTKIQWLLDFMSRTENSYPSKFVFDRLVYYIYSIAIGLLEKQEQALMAHINRESKDISARVAPKDVPRAMQMLQPFYDEINDINTQLSTLIERRKNVPKPEQQEQSPGYFGWWKRK